MKSKKADIRISHFIGGIIAIIVLVVIAWYLYSSTDTFKNFFSWIGFNMTTEPISGIGIVRYDISTAKVMHYDGTEWQEFEELKIGDKTIKANTLKDDFTDWYFYGREKKIVKIDTSFEHLLRSLKNDNENSMDLPHINFVVKQSNAEVSVNDLRVNAQIRRFLMAGDFNRGILIDLIKSDNNERIVGAGHFILKEDDTLIYRYILAGGIEDERSFFVSTSKSGNIIKNLLKETKNWRDSIFTKPIPIKIDEENTKYYCTQLWDNKFAVVYLDKEAKENDKCKEVKTEEIKEPSPKDCFLRSNEDGIQAFFSGIGIKPLSDSYLNIEENKELTHIILELGGTCDEIPKFIEIFQIDESGNNIEKVYDSNDFTPNDEDKIVFPRTIGEEGLYKIIIYCPNKPSESGCLETAKEGDKWAWVRYFKIAKPL